MPISFAEQYRTPNIGQDIKIHRPLLTALDNQEKVNEIAFRTLKMASLTAIIGGTAFGVTKIIQGLTIHGLPKETKSKVWLGLLCFAGIGGSYEIIRDLYNAKPTFRERP